MTDDPAITGPRRIGAMGWLGVNADEVLLETEVAAKAVGVTPATLRDWVRRGLLTRADGTPRKPLWRASDLIRAKAAAKPRHARNCPVIDPDQKGPR